MWPLFAWPLGAVAFAQCRVQIVFGGAVSNGLMSIERVATELYGHRADLGKMHEKTLDVVR